MTPHHFWQKSKQYLKLPWELVAIVAVFLLFHLPKLAFPHFWDEAWVYAPAIRSMAGKGPSLLPDAISLDLTRGHPLLFQFMGGLWMKVFGISNTSAHAFALSLTLLLLVVLYMLVRQYHGRGAALAATLFVAAQPMFVALSAMLYPEVLLSLGLLLAIFGSAYNRTILFVTGLSVALYAKESALVFFVAFLAWDVLRILVLKDSWRLLLKFIVPALVLISHPLLLYIYHGWFLYPEHTSLITTNLGDIMYRLRMILDFVFQQQYRGWLLYPLMVLGVLSLRLKHFWVKPVLLVLGFVAYKVLFVRWVIPEPLFPLVVAIACVAPPVLWFYMRGDKKITPVHHFFALGYLVITGFILFSAMNFYTPRYMLNTVTLACVMGAILLWRSFLPRWAKIAVTAAGVMIPLYATYSLREVGELTLGVYDDMKVQQGMVEWMVDNALREDTVCTNFVTSVYLRDEYAGYVNHDNYFIAPFQNVCSSECNGKYIIYTATTSFCEEFQHDLSGYRKVYSDTINQSFATVFRRKN